LGKGSGDLLRGPISISNQSKENRGNLDLWRIPRPAFAVANTPQEASRCGGNRKSRIGFVSLLPLRYYFRIRQIG
jgi:hypothetical protein